MRGAAERVVGDGGMGLEESGAAPFGSHRRDKEGNSLVQSTLTARAPSRCQNQSATSPELGGGGHRAGAINMAEERARQARDGAARALEAVL